MYRGFTAGEIASITGGRVSQGNEQAIITGVSTDSRQIRSGDLFVAVCGERVDGHDFAGQAVDRGASAVLVSRDTDTGGTLIRVKNTVRALGLLGAFVRTELSPLVIGITGSVGKTTTKDMVAAVIGQRWHTLKNRGNYNTEIGVPLTLLELTLEHEAVVVEMGMRGRGQIAYLAELAGPRIGVVTNVGIAHMEFTGGIDVTARCKAELLMALPGDGVAVVNADDVWCEWMADRVNCRVIRYSLRQDGEVRAEDIRSDRSGIQFELCVADQRVPVVIRSPGRHNVPNALAAAAVGLAMGMDGEEIASGLGKFEAGPMRSRIVSRCGVDIIDDTYNASPDSLEAALSLITDIAPGRKLAVLGPMLELGERTAVAHRHAGKRAAESGLQYLVVVGELGAVIADGAIEAGMSKGQVIRTSSNADAVQALTDKLQRGDTVLIKGSRGAAMEEIVSALTEGGCR